MTLTIEGMIAASVTKMHTFKSDYASTEHILNKDTKIICTIAPARNPNKSAKHIRVTWQINFERVTVDEVNKVLTF